MSDYSYISCDGNIRRDVNEKPAFKFHWHLSYMGECYWKAYGPGFDNGEELTARHSLGEYELSIANGDVVRNDMKSAMFTIRRRAGQPMPYGAVDAFNRHLRNERANAIVELTRRGMEDYLPTDPVIVYRDKYAESES